jgi:small GTP-binding protein
VIINNDEKEILIKVVFYGPGRSGKTTNLEFILNTYKDRVSNRVTVVNTQDESILFFDYLPLDIGKIKDHRIRIQFYTVPGEVRYEATRRLLLDGVDGIVFVADSMAVRREKNLVSLKSLQENLVAYGLDPSVIPMVFQYNKRDLEGQGIPILSVEYLQRDLNAELKAPFFEASARRGKNVIPTMKNILSLTMHSLRGKIEDRLKQIPRRSHDERRSDG